MAYTHQLNINVTGAGISQSASILPTGDTELAESLIVPISTTNQAAAFAFVLAKTQLVYIQCDQPLTIKTNNASSPGNTITLAAGQPFFWYVGCSWTNLFTVDVTGLYLSNASATLPANLTTLVLTNSR